MASKGYGCANIVESEKGDDRDPTLVTRLLQDFDECLETSKENLNDAGKKADRLRRRASRHPERVRKMLTPIPQEVEGEEDEVSEMRETSSN